MSGRPRYAIVMVGRRFTGKSTEIRKVLDKNEEPNSIIIDPNGAPAYEDIPYVEFEKLKRLKSGKVKFYNPDRNRMWAQLAELFDPQLPKRKYLNGIMVIEDATKLIPKNVPPNVQAMLVDGRMWNADLIFTFHSLKAVPPFFWDFATHIIIKKTQDMVDENLKFYESRIPNFKDWYPAWQQVSKSKNDYISKTIRTLI